jgi:hypothetical protein
MSERQELINQIVDLKTGLIEDTKEEETSSNQNISIYDSEAEAVKILLPNYSSDKEFLEYGKVDIRRFSNVGEIDVYWLSWFSLIEDQYGGEWANNWCQMWMNIRDSVGGEHKKLGISAIEALGEKADKTQKKDLRSAIKKYITQRGKPRYE